MSNLTDDLWPDIPEISSIHAPRAILAEQAALLGSKTQNVVTANVVTMRRSEPGVITYGFDLVAPALSNYRVRLFKVSHNIRKIYPVWFHDLDPEITFIEEVDNELDFIASLRTILQNQATIMTLQSLLAQSDGFDNDLDDIPF